ncbi:hypothetical protein B296_00008065 [Ensete ventricosum]|uniref:Uncharacterized protein n=1 Tax=Ensete ventricosum TaxID=4639 RepID=A0A427AC08_ENSVE|nr:hypothetical protein B296_00008065 [Ensete ventricosum]
MRTTPRPATYKPLAPPAPSCASLPKKLTREELRDRSAKGLWWHCNELWSRNHHCKKGKLSMIEPIEESEEDDLEPEEENTKEDPQLTDCLTHTLAGHVNPQAMKDEESLKQQSVTILIKTRSPNDLINGKVKPVTLHGKCGSEEKTQCLEKFATSTGSSRFHPTRLYDLRMLILQEEPLAHIRLYCYPHPQRAEAKRII